MIGIHSVFSSDYRHHIYNPDHPISLVELYTWVYSILTWKRDGHRMILFCDETIEKFITKYGFNDLYDEIRVREFQDEYHECFWSYNKIRVLKEFGEPVCLFDVDTFFRDTEFTKWHKDMICYHYETFDGSENVRKLYENEVFKGLSFYEPIDENFKMVNGCMLIFNSYDLKNEFLRNAKEVVETIKDVTAKSDDEWNSYTIFMEQINLGYLNRKYHCPSVSEDYEVRHLPKLDVKTQWEYREKMKGVYGNFLFDSNESVGHLSAHKYFIEKGNPTTKRFFIELMKEKIIELGYPKHSKLFNLTYEDNNVDFNSLIPEREKPFNRHPKNMVDNEVYSDWFENNRDLLFDDRFSIPLWGSIGGRDIDLLVSKKESVSISELEEYLTKLIYSGDELEITVEALYISDIDYLREFRMENSKKVYEDVLIGFISEHPYESIGEVRRYGKMVFHYGPFNDAYYLCSNKYDDILFIDNVKDIKNNKGYTHFSSEVYNTIYERFGIFSIIE